jgi:L-threonylcarbamoyladenylate synthase
MHYTAEASITDEIKNAASRLNSGGVVVYPTETFFALGCRIDLPLAIERIFQLKKRSHQTALPVLIHSYAQLSSVAQMHAYDAQSLDKLCALWPAPLTLLLDVSPAIPTVLTAGTGKIALRMSPHPAASMLTELCGCPIVSTSANISGMPPSTHASAISRELLDALDVTKDAILDVPPQPSGGLPSTIVEPCGAMKLRVLRLGAFDTHSLERLGFAIINE